MERVNGADVWRVASDLVTLDVSLAGGMSTAEFRLGERKVHPYSLSPWEPGEIDESFPELLRTLRGDFLCLPFGPQDDGPPHGESANAEWTELDSADGRLVIGLPAGDTGAKIEKEYRLLPGQSAIYYEFRISGLEGEWSYGNHPIIDFSAMGDGDGFLSVSPFRWASVYPGVFSKPEKKEYQTLEAGGEFVDLREVPLASGGTTDVSRYPARRGFEDLVMMVNEESSDEQPFAWSAAVLDGYVWFSLKNPEDFPATLLWLSNGGRHDEPWNGGHVGRVGIEEVCSHFCDGVDDSRVSALKARGIRTTRAFRKGETTTLRILQAVAEVPARFGRVASISPDGPSRVVITSETGLTVSVTINWGHVLFR